MPGRVEIGAGAGVAHRHPQGSAVEEDRGLKAQSHQRARPDQDLEDWKGLAAVLSTKVERTYDPIERAELLRRGASVLEELLGDPEAAIELYERAVERAESPTRAITYLFKIGAVYEDLLGEPAQAAHAYQRILELDPDGLGAIHALQRATERAGRRAAAAWASRCVAG